MGKHKNKKTGSARKKGNRENSTLPESLNTPENAVGSEGPFKLKPTYPNPCKGFESLSKYQITFLTNLILKYIALLFPDKIPRVNMEYWRFITMKVLGVQNREQALVIPARAGAGKSTWITAFILALSELHLNNDPLPKCLVGIILVLQKVETLNAILDTIESFFPGRSGEVMVAIQGWSKSGQEKGFCQNKKASSFEDCQKEQCPYASTCQVLHFAERAKSSFIIGMTQARFNMLRESGELEVFLQRNTCDSKEPIPRRFILFDEKFDMSKMSSIGVPDINEASTEMERLNRSRNPTDSEIVGIQKGLNFCVLKPIQELRERLVFKDKVGNDEMPFGLCQLSDENQKSALNSFTESFQRYRSGLMTPNIKKCISAAKKLFDGACLFIRSSGFRLVSAEPRQLLFGSAQTIIFDATAEVDGDYLYLDQASFLPSSPALHMDQVTFHLYEHPDLNVSRSAMKKTWKLPAFVTLIEELVNQWKGDTFLCTYKDYADYIPEQLSEITNERILKMKNKEKPCLPYFGGTNGDNNFNQCTNVIILGYPRLSPPDYLQHAYAAWGEHGLTDEIQDLVNKMEFQDELRKDSFRSLKLLAQYESLHLAARLEQEIYRCALRNADCDSDINVVLFCPPNQMMNKLLERFDGCSVKCYQEVPPGVAFHRDTTRSYGGTPTAYSKLATFLTEWNGDSIKSRDLREQLDISESAWKDLIKSGRTIQLLEDYKVIRTGRGPNTTFQCQETLCA